MTRRERRRPHSEERRTQRRIDAHHLPSLRAHISGGSKVTLLDMSQGGVRIETTRHMRPGQVVSVRFSVDDRVVTINAKVVRAAVVRLQAEEVRYETGLRLTEEFSCDELRVAMVERRRSAGDGVTDAPDGAEGCEDIVFTRMADGGTLEDGHRGWWLAGKRRRRHRALQGY